MDKVFPAVILKSMPAAMDTYRLREYPSHMSDKKREISQWEKEECAKLKAALEEFNAGKSRKDSPTPALNSPQRHPSYLTPYPEPA